MGSRKNGKKRGAKEDCAVLAGKGVSLCRSGLCCYVGLLGFGGEVVFVVFPLTEGNVPSQVL